MRTQAGVAVFLLTDRQDFQRAQEAAARTVAARTGLRIEVAFADNSPVLQIKQIYSCINRPPEARPAAIVAELAGVPAGMSQVALAALAAHVGWVTLSPETLTLERLRLQFPGELVTSVTTDDEEVGRIHAAQCRALLPAGGDILYLEGPGLNVAVKARRRTLEAGLQGSGITIAKTVPADWTEDGGRSACARWLLRSPRQRPLPQLICSQNDAMAVGARRAVLARLPRSAGTPMVGCDGLLDGGQRYVKEGLLTATVLRPVTAGQGVELAARAVRGEAVPASVVLPVQSYPPLEALSAGPRADDA